ncbi:uncharacterized protein [Physcomitrium patens]|uniref:Anaphase-promoting complex subunit 4 WD40 domain-containing protein n=1 Tax=Physcomitrium patens TaxID=3218 RepID=A0A7I4A762_PHYPA|nr:uncharacterized protein LOC112287500 isoform X2 [Physcomitrium patens]|eukprot:XP_024386314.1 uncharacterized protein LOC112287500 isoform X2 [Physcomitrella patens]
MMPSWLDGSRGSSSPSTSKSNHQSPPCARYHPYARKQQLGGNVTRLLALREVAPSVKRPARWLWGKAASGSAVHAGPRLESTSAKLAITSWVEAESLRYCTAKYCPLQPAPRSTIAAAFSPDGNTLASTHGDHTVKIICCRTGQCLKVLSGHRRTPWVVRFHPASSEVLASGSLDNEVRLWNANTAECVGSRDFHRPIASLAFHAQGDLLAVASGHKLYIWQFTKAGDVSPTIVLRTRRSLRAVHFHPLAAPFLLTAEVNDLDSPDCPMTLATSQGYLHYPPPAIHFTPSTSSTLLPNHSVSNQVSFVPLPSWFWPVLTTGSDLIFQTDLPTAVEAGDDGNVNFAEDSTSPIAESELNVDTGRPSLMTELQFPDFSSPAPMDISPRPVHDDVFGDSTANDVSTSGREPLEEGEILENNESINDFNSQSRLNAHDRIRGAPWEIGGSTSHPASIPPAGYSNTASTRGPSSIPIPIPSSTSPRQDSGGAALGPAVWPMSAFPNLNTQMLGGASGGIPSFQNFLPVGEYTGWELPFLHGWVQGQQAQAGTAPSVVPSTVPVSGPWQSAQEQQQQNAAISVASVAIAAAVAAARTAARAGAGVVGAPNAGIGADIGAGSGVSSRMGSSHGITIPGRGGANIGAAEAAAAQAAMAAAAAAAELPCTVKLRIWPHDIKRPCATLDPETCRLVIPHAVLCSEMGAHFSPCGRFLAACVACVLPMADSDSRRGNTTGSPAPGSSAHSPTQHPISSQQVIYELRVYSLEEATFGQVLASRAVRAAHCLTSIQFSPTSGHILLAYGRRHNSLLRSLVVDGSATIPIRVYTILEVYRVSDMELVRVLPSAEDEVNVACFHPQVGGGLVYGTKEGKLRILRHDRTPLYLNPRSGLEDELLEAETLDPLSFGMVADIGNTL